MTGRSSSTEITLSVVDSVPLIVRYRPRSTCFYGLVCLLCTALLLVGFLLLRSISIRYEPITFNVNVSDSPIDFHYFKDQTMKNANLLKGLHMNPKQPLLELRWMKEFLDTDK